MEFDLFGVEVSHYQLNEHIDMPSDAQRIGCHLSRRCDLSNQMTYDHVTEAWLSLLASKGYLSKLLISHDIHTKHR